MLGEVIPVLDCDVVASLTGDDRDTWLSTSLQEPSCTPLFFRSILGLPSVKFTQIRNDKTATEKSIRQLIKQVNDTEILVLWVHLLASLIVYKNHHKSLQEIK